MSATYQNVYKSTYLKGPEGTFFYTIENVLLKHAEVKVGWLQK